jgi:hypothetical protein
MIDRNPAAKCEKCKEKDDEIARLRSALKYAVGVIREGEDPELYITSRKERQSEE